MEREKEGGGGGNGLDAGWKDFKYVCMQASIGKRQEGGRKTPESEL